MTTRQERVQELNRRVRDIIMQEKSVLVEALMLVLRDYGLQFAKLDDLQTLWDSLDLRPGGPAVLEVLFCSLAARDAAVEETVTELGEVGNA